MWLLIIYQKFFPLSCSLSLCLHAFTVLNTNRNENEKNIISSFWQTKKLNTCGSKNIGPRKNLRYCVQKAINFWEIVKVLRKLKSYLKSFFFLRPKKDITNFSCVIFALTDKFSLALYEMFTFNRQLSSLECKNPLQTIWYLSILTHFQIFSDKLMHAHLCSVSKLRKKNLTLKMFSSYMTCLFKQVCLHCWKTDKVCSTLVFRTWNRF